MFRTVWVVASLALGVACAEPNAPDSASLALAGTYILETVNGTPLPFLKEQSDTGRIEVVVGVLTLRPDRTYHGEIIEELTGAQETDSLRKVSDGTFSISANVLTFKESGGAVHRGSTSGKRLSATLNDVTFGFVKQ